MAVLEIGYDVIIEEVSRDYTEHLLPSDIHVVSQEQITPEGCSRRVYTLLAYTSFPSLECKEQDLKNVDSLRSNEGVVAVRTGIGEHCRANLHSFLRSTSA